RDNPLAKPEIMEGFAAKIREATVNWTDITPLAEKADKAEKALKEANKAYYSTLGKDSALRGVDLDNVADVRKAVAGDPEKLRLVDELERARIARDESKRALNQALEPRMAEVQKVMDQLADSQGLPRVKITTEDLGGKAAVGDYIDGELRINRHY